MNDFLNDLKKISILLNYKYYLNLSVVDVNVR